MTSEARRGGAAFEFPFVTNLCRLSQKFDAF